MYGWHKNRDKKANFYRENEEVSGWKVQTIWKNTRKFLLYVLTVNKNKHSEEDAPHFVIFVGYFIGKRRKIMLNSNFCTWNLNEIDLLNNHNSWIVPEACK